jgi:5-methylcytosine-specific restriction enzyme A
MPQPAPRACHAPGCPQTTRSGAYCDEHRRERGRRRDQDDPDHRFYHTARWRRFRLWFLHRHPLCVMCAAVRLDRPARHVDHIVPRKLRPDLSLVEENCQGLCHSCHSRKTRREQQQRGPVGGMNLYSFSAADHPPTACVFPRN